MDWHSLPLFPGGRDGDGEGGVQWDQSACDREPTQLEEYSWRGNGESRGQLGMEAEGQK